ncbi:uncharacterized protein LOC108916564 [Anoplophora glabripennis]|uniref:uncharacterized protein LOC108916564 n=1 Tax=Anoplophora glabripennis TaxID=217634 RepID=UPI000873D0B1|nr:uncharacterized protein LOC108916564 [Anoplophora glabripennis]
MNKENVIKYFDLLQDILIEYNLIGKPGNIFNIDETGLQLNNKPGYVVAAKGSRSVSNVTSGEKGETISVIACCNGEGVFLPPACVLKGKNEKPEYKDGMPPGSAIYMSQKSAYVTSEIFYLWLRNHFLPRKPVGTVLMILDGHSSHCSAVDMLEFAEKNNIILLCLPSHTTHYLQPLDRAFFKSFKTFYYNACNVFMKANPMRKINRLVFGRLLSEAWIKAATPSNGISGFHATGIVPFNPHVVPDYAFLTDVPPQGENCQPALSDPPPTTQAGHLQPSPSHQPSTTNNVAGNSVSSGPGCSNLVLIELPQAARYNNNNCSDPVSNNSSDDAITPGKMLDQIFPVPNLPRLEAARKRARNLASVLNTENNIKILKEKIQVKCNKEVIKNKVKQTKNKTIKKKLEMLDKSDEESEPDLDDEEEVIDDDDNDYCVGCSEEYKATKKSVDWIKCVRCERWLHEDCTKYGNYCDTCGKFVLKRKKI